MFQPVQALTVNVDPGAMSGWALLAPLQRQAVLAHGHLKPTLDAVQAVLLDARNRATALGLPMVLIGETWGVGGYMTPAVAAGLERSWAPWELLWESMNLGLALPASTVVRVHLATWRSKVLGVPVGSMSKAAAKKAAREYVRIRCGFDVTADEAEAICIGFWGQHSVEVRAAI